MTDMEEKNPEILFQAHGMIDVTNYNAMKPSDPLGYLCGGTATVFADGIVEVASDEETLRFPVDELFLHNMRCAWCPQSILLASEACGIRLRFDDEPEKTETLYRLLLSMQKERT